jgi:hypothetical protein
MRGPAAARQLPSGTGQGRASAWTKQLMVNSYARKGGRHGCDPPGHRMQLA